MAKITGEIRSLFREYERPKTILEPVGNVHEWEERRKEACKELRQRLAPEKIDKLIKDDVSDLLNFDKNQTMEARRVTPHLVKNIEEFKGAIRMLTDESRDIKERLNEALKAPGVGHATATMILSIHNPEKYPFWSKPKEETLKKIGVIDELTGTYGDKYVQIIEAEKELSSDLNADLVKLDTFLWWLFNKKFPPNGGGEVGESFKAEKELKKYLRENLEEIERGLSLVENGVEYQTDVGRIDLLCKDKKGIFIVVELKRFKGSDKDLGQLLRYMGWVIEKKAEEKDVRGILITHEFDENLEYAVKAVANFVKLKYYAINFELSDGPFKI